MRNRRLSVFPKVDAASPRGLMAPPGLTALGAKGSVRDRLPPPGRVEGSALGRYEAPLRWRGRAPLWAPFFMPPLAAKTFTTGLRPSENHTTALRASEMHSPFGGWRHHLARWEACHWIRGSRGSPMKSSSFATSAVRLVNQKEGPFMGRLRAYFDQLAHPMQDVHSGTIIRAYCRAADEAGLRGVLFFPLNRGKSGAAG